ncbi:MAG: glycosyl transferase [Gammaproteobacteria bacterium]
MNFFCTLFDTNYLSRGIALYHSLRQQLGEDFHLFVFPFDQSSYDLLTVMNMPQLTVVAQSEFETDDLLAVKQNRKPGEYCWTCTPAIIEHLLETYEIDHCTYLDADTFFFDSPALILNHLDKKDVIITEHRFTTQYDRTDSVGRFCVQFVYFNQTENARSILKHWREQCIEWCFDKIEDGKFGDQKYLDEWPASPNVFIPHHLGVGVAPWNVQQYEVRSVRGKPYIYDEKGSQCVPLVFYHFHGLKFINAHEVDLGGYKLEQSVVDNIYKPYWTLLKEIENRLNSLGVDLNIHGIRTSSSSGWLDNWKRKIKGTYNVQKLKESVPG